MEWNLNVGVIRYEGNDTFMQFHTHIIFNSNINQTLTA